jgi:hypothetical protein
MQAKLVVVGGRANRREIPLRLPLTVGRARECDLVVEHRTVSHSHCELFERDGWLCVRDNGSLNGTLVGTSRVTEAIVKPGDRLTIGPLVFEAAYDRAAGAKNGHKPDPAPAIEDDAPTDISTNMATAATAIGMADFAPVADDPIADELEELNDETPLEPLADLLELEEEPSAAASADEPIAVASGDVDQILPEPDSAELAAAGDDSLLDDLLFEEEPASTAASHDEEMAFDLESPAETVAADEIAFVDDLATDDLATPLPESGPIQSVASPAQTPDDDLALDWLAEEEPAPAAQIPQELAEPSAEAPVAKDRSLDDADALDWDDLLGSPTDSPSAATESKQVDEGIDFDFLGDDTNAAAAEPVAEAAPTAGSDEIAFDELLAEDTGDAADPAPLDALAPLDELEGELAAFDELSGLDDLADLDAVAEADAATESKQVDDGIDFDFLGDDTNAAAAEPVAEAAPTAGSDEIAFDELLAKDTGDAADPAPLDALAPLDELEGELAAFDELGGLDDLADLDAVAEADASPLDAVASPASQATTEGDEIDFNFLDDALSEEIVEQGPSSADSTEPDAIAFDELLADEPNTPADPAPLDALAPLDELEGELASLDELGGLEDLADIDAHNLDEPSLDAELALSSDLAPTASPVEKETPPVSSAGSSAAKALPAADDDGIDFNFLDDALDADLASLSDVPPGDPAPPEMPTEAGPEIEDLEGPDDLNLDDLNLDDLNFDDLSDELAPLDDILVNEQTASDLALPGDIPAEESLPGEELASLDDRSAADDLQLDLSFDDELGSLDLDSPNSSEAVVTRGDGVAADEIEALDFDFLNDAVIEDSLPDESSAAPPAKRESPTNNETLSAPMPEAADADLDDAFLADLDLQAGDELDLGSIAPHETESAGDELLSLEAELDLDLGDELDLDALETLESADVGPAAAASQPIEFESTEEPELAALDDAGLDLDFPDEPVLASFDDADEIALAPLDDAMLDEAMDLPAPLPKQKGPAEAQIKESKRSIPPAEPESSARAGIDPAKTLSDDDLDEFLKGLE